MSARGHVAYLTGQYPNAGSTFIRVEVEQLRRQGFSVSTFSVRRPAPDQLVSEALRAEHARTFYLFDGPKGRLIAAGLWALATRPQRLPGAVRRILATTPGGLRSRFKGIAYLLEACLLAREVTRSRIDHIHDHLAEASASVAMAAAWLSGVSFSLTEHGSGIFFHPRAWGLGSKIEAATFTACISDFCRSQCMLFAPPHAWPRIHRIRACVQPEFLAGDAAPVPEAPRLLFVGRLSAEKGLPLLIEAVRRLDARGSQIELTLIGDGTLRGEAERQLASLGGRLRLLGWCGSDVVRREIARARALVLPSLTEGLPVVLLEALAMHRPVIATHIAGIPELVVDGVNGWLIAPGSVEALERAIREVLAASPDTLQRLGEAGAARVREAHDSELEVRKLAALFDASLRGRQAGSAGGAPDLGSATKSNAWNG
ncbi:MAG TPA: glycosyltransferase [Myxococcota bacterium]